MGVHECTYESYVHVTSLDKTTLKGFNRLI